MSTIELRHIISQQLAQIEDAIFLNNLKTIIERKLSEGTYKLSDFQKSRVQSARLQRNTNKTLSNEILETEIEEWLKSK
jgi:hypothetical protein